MKGAAVWTKARDARREALRASAHANGGEAAVSRHRNGVRSAASAPTPDCEGFLAVLIGYVVQNLLTKQYPQSSNTVRIKGTSE